MVSQKKVRGCDGVPADGVSTASPRRRPSTAFPARAPSLRSRVSPRVRRPPPLGTKRFPTPEIKEHVEEYNKAKADTEEAPAANRLFALGRTSR